MAEVENTTRNQASASTPIVSPTSGDKSGAQVPRKPVEEKEPFPFAVTVGQMIEFVRRRMMIEDRPVRLRQLLRNLHSHQALICAFLALLELIRLQAVLARQDKVFGDIVLKKHTMFDTVLGDTAAVKDDWR